MGRPSKFSEAIANEILERISNGEPLTKICTDSHMPSCSTVFYWEHSIAGFSEKVTRARECSADHYSHEIIEIAEEKPIANTSGDGWERSGIDPAGIQRNKLRIDTRIKLMQMLKRKTYGEKLAVEHSGSVELAERIASARKRSDG